MIPPQMQHSHAILCLPKRPACYMANEWRYKSQCLLRMACHRALHMLQEVVKLFLLVVDLC